MKTPTKMCVCLFVCLFVCLCWRVPERPRRFFTFFLDLPTWLMLRKMWGGWGGWGDDHVPWTCQHGMFTFVFYYVYSVLSFFLVGGWSVLLRASGKILSGLCVQWRSDISLDSTNDRTGNCFFVVCMFRWKHGNFLQHPWELLCWQTTYQPGGKYSKTNFLGRGSKWRGTCTKHCERKVFPQKENPSKTFWTRVIYFDVVSYAVHCIIFLPGRWCWKETTGSFQGKQVHLISGPRRTSFRTCDLRAGHFLLRYGDWRSCCYLSQIRRLTKLLLSQTRRGTKLLLVKWPQTVQKVCRLQFLPMSSSMHCPSLVHHLVLLTLRDIESRS